jgi:fructose/tagatose bisphosphate aldolase
MGDENALTTVEDAVHFYNDTKVDALAISVGTVHGFYKAAPCIDVKRCREIADALPETPLVLHGGSGTPPEDVRALIENGITKINIATEFMDTFLKSTKKQFDILEGKFRAVDLFNDPVVDDCAAYASKMLRFFAGK